MDVCPRCLSKDIFMSGSPGPDMTNRQAQQLHAVVHHVPDLQPLNHNIVPQPEVSAAVAPPGAEVTCQVTWCTHHEESMLGHAPQPHNVVFHARVCQAQHVTLKRRALPRVRAGRQPCQVGVRRRSAQRVIVRAILRRLRCAGSVRCATLSVRLRTCTAQQLCAVSRTAESMQRECRT